MSNYPLKKWNSFSSERNIFVLQCKAIFFSCIKRAALYFFQIPRKSDSRKKAQLFSKKATFPKLYAPCS